MPLVHPPPTPATAKELYGNAVRCASPGCTRPLYKVDPETKKRTRNSKIAHICARAEGGPRWDPDMSPDENRSVNNLIVLCVEHADEIDDPDRVEDFPVEALKDWKKGQLETSDEAGGGIQLSDEEAADVVGASFQGDVAIQGSTVFLGGEGGQAPGAGGGGGGAIGPGAVGGEGGEGGEVDSGFFLAEDLPDVVEIKVGRGGRGGDVGEDGQDGGDSAFGDLLRARGGRGGKARRILRPPVKSEESSRLRVSAVMLANSAEVREGLLYVLGAGWSHYTVPALPADVAWPLIVILDVDDPSNETATAVIMELSKPGGSALCHVEVPVEVPPTDEVVRVPVLVSLQTQVTEPGMHHVRVVHGDEEIAHLGVEVRLAE